MFIYFCFIILKLCDSLSIQFIWIDYFEIIHIQLNIILIQISIILNFVSGQSVGDAGDTAGHHGQHWHRHLWLKIKVVWIWDISATFFGIFQLLVIAGNV